jgi:Calcineurin-like phosphoesterase
VIRAFRVALVTAVSVAVMAGALTDAPATDQRPDRSERRADQPRLLAVGDIACDSTSPYFGKRRLCQQRAVGHRVRTLVRQGADWFVPLGDNQYERGTLPQYRKVYQRAFGDVRSVTRPITGNHEYLTKNARGYFRYFGKRAGDRHGSWRSFVPAPGWRVLLLDSNCEFVGGCGPRSDQGRWIKNKLASSSEPCMIAAWHHPLRSSGEYAGSADSRGRAQKLWKLVDAGGVDVVLNAHDHIYERFHKRGGVQQFLVGTGGKNHYRITTRAKGSQKRIGNRYGVLQLTLRPDGSYRHAFVTTSGKLRDRGSNRCTNEPTT